MNNALLVRLQHQQALDRYKQALDSLSNAQPQTWLPVLFARDHVEKVPKQSITFSHQQAQRIVEIDEQLRQQATEGMLSALPSWRKSFEPPESSWWWFLDQAASKTKALNRYQKALNDLKQEQPDTLLPVLLARDHVEKLLPPKEGLSLSFSDEQVKKLLELDKKLRQNVTGPLLEKFETLRSTCRPAESHWWWFLDEATEKRRVEQGFGWEVLASTLVIVFTIPIAIDLIKRLWDGAPDFVSFFALSSYYF